jgi:hypothetical protein
MKIQPMSRALPTQIEHPRATYFGPDWTSSLLRPGCQQHLGATALRASLASEQMQRVAMLDRK